MSAPLHFKQPLIVRIPELLREFEERRILVARFQRPFIWTDDQRLDLFDSIYNGMPIGSLLTWRTNEKRLKCYDNLGPFKLKERNEEKGPYEYLLDGHQRLTTMYTALLLNQQEDYEGEEKISWPIYFDLDDQRFKLHKVKGDPQIFWFPLHLAFDTRKVFDFMRKLYEEDVDTDIRVEKLEGLISILKDYSIPLVPLVTESLPQVTTSFQRINSKGTDMSEVHMANALTWTEEFDLNEKLEEACERLRAIGWGDLEAQQILNVVKAICGQDIMKTDLDRISQRLKKDKSLIEQSVRAIEIAADFLQETCKILGPKSLPYSYQLVLLAEALKNTKPLDKVRKGLLERWFWTTTFSRYFTSASWTELRNAQKSLKEILEEGTLSNSPQLITRVEPCSQFNYRSVRSRAIALLLASLNPRSNNNKAYEGFQLLADHGNETMMQLFSTRDIKNKKQQYLTASAANRFIIEPRDQKSFKEFLTGPQYQISLEQFPSREKLLTNLSWLMSHAISKKAAYMLKKNDAIGFLEARMETITSLERHWVEKLGLFYDEGKE